MIKRIKKFSEVTGQYIERIAGQNRFAYGMSGSDDLYDLVEFAKRGGYQGSVIRFYDFENGKIYIPFEKKRDIIYGRPVYVEGFFYFLKGDYELKKVILYKYLPESSLENVIEFDIDEVDLYNLGIIGDKVHVISQDEKSFRCYYPEKFSLPLGDSETVDLIADERVFISAWVEEGWDMENNCATDNYKYYEKLIIKDFKGNKISEEIGCLYQAEDGDYWIS